MNSSDAEPSSLREHAEIELFGIDDCAVDRIAAKTFERQRL
jgi:hypothetical protein